MIINHQKLVELESVVDIFAPHKGRHLYNHLFISLEQGVILFECQSLFAEMLMDNLLVDCVPHIDYEVHLW